MKRDPSLYLQHILDAIARTETYLHGVNEAALLKAQVQSIFKEL